MTRLAADVRATFTADGAEPFTVDAAVEAETGKNLVVLGPSGSGKTLLLETIAGFYDHQGSVAVDGTDIAGRAPEVRDFGFVFQEYALFPHMTVRENVEYGARYCDSPRDPDDLLSGLGVGDLAERNPPTLSGGEKQRVALARALAVRPEVLLLDEPLAALDVPTRQSLRNDLADVLADVTSIYVTHNRTTARAIADRIAVMRDGAIVQRGSPDDVFELPVSPAVARFTGSNVIDLSAAPTLQEALDADSFRPRADEARPEPVGDIDAAGGRSEHVAIRPEAIVLGDDDGDLRATVERVAREDATSRVTLAFDDVTAETFADAPPSVGDSVSLRFPRDRLTRW